MMKYKLVNSLLALLFSSVVLLLSSCASSPAFLDPKVNPSIADSESKKYNVALLDAIQNADKIMIKEHSDKIDFFNLIPEFEIAPYYIYALKELNTGEKILFLDDVRKLKGVAKKDIKDCIFEPHHTIDFYENGLLKSTMRISYKCGDIKWNGSNLQASQDVFGALTAVINRAGMQTERPWDALAKQQYEKENQVTPPRIDPNPVGVPTAKWAPGQVGKKVINPYTGRLVDVEGIPASTKVRDPNDPDPTHIFRVPGM
jgi:hypothetical protein